MAQFNTFFVPHSDDGTELESLNAFLRGRRVLQVDRQAFPSGWAFCVEWLERSASVGGRFDRGRNGPKIDYREVLDPEVFARFAKLRERRKAIAEADGVKPYVVMTDAQLAEVAKMEQPKAADLYQIPGVGESRVKMYADRLLEQETASGDETPPVA